MRNLSVGERQGRGDVPAFDATRLHRIPADPKPTGEPSYRFWAWVGVAVFAFLCFIAISLKGGAS